MSLKTKLIMYPTIVVLGAVAAAGFHSLPSRQKMMYDSIMVTLSVTVEPDTHAIPIKIEFGVNAQPTTKDTTLNTWTRRIPVRRGDLVLLTTEQFEKGRMVCAIQVPGQAPISNTTIRAEKITCAKAAI